VSSSKSEADSSESPNYNEFSGAHAKVKQHSTYIESIHGVAESTEEVKKRRAVELVLVPKRVVLAFVLYVQLSDILTSPTLRLHFSSSVHPLRHCQRIIDNASRVHEPCDLNAPFLVSTRVRPAYSSRRAERGFSCSALSCIDSKWSALEDGPRITVRTLGQ
jgi:hypothetical protein